jgi:hypothetical protein
MACDRSVVVSLGRQGVSSFCRRLTNHRMGIITYPSIVEMVSVPKE